MQIFRRALRPPKAIVFAIAPHAFLAIRPDQHEIALAVSPARERVGHSDQETACGRAVVRARTTRIRFRIIVRDKHNPPRIRIDGTKCGVKVGEASLAFRRLCRKRVTPNVRPRRAGRIQQIERRLSSALRPRVARRILLNQRPRRFKGKMSVSGRERKRRSQEKRKEAHRQSTVTPIMRMMRSSSSLSKKSISTTPFVCRPLACETPGVTRTAQPRCFFILSTRVRT